MVILRDAVVISTDVSLVRKLPQLPPSESDFPDIRISFIFC